MKNSGLKDFRKYYGLVLHFSNIRGLTTIIFVILAAAFFVGLTPGTAQADITRGCQGIFWVNVVGGDNINQANTYRQFDTFEGRGACKNKAQANTCRARAKDNVFRCATDLWNARWSLIGNPNDEHPDGGLPEICQGRTTGAKNVGPFKKNSFGQYFDIKHAIEYEGCCVLQPKSNSLQLSVSVTSTGDNGCGSKKRTKYGTSYQDNRTLESNYKVNCKQLRKNGICAK